MSFFDDGDETVQQPAARERRGRPSARAGGGSRGPRARRPQRSGGTIGPDQRTLLIRRGVAFAIGVVVLIVIVLVINGCLKSEKQESLKTYNREVSRIGGEAQELVAKPLFAALASAPSKKALEVDEEVNQLRLDAQAQQNKVKHLSVPGEMEGAQRDLLLVVDLRAEGMEKLSTLLQTALASKSKKSLQNIAGDMEIFLASDVIYAERVVPLIQQTLSANGVTGLTTAPSRFVPNIGWLETSVLSSRLTGQASSTSTTTTGTHGSALIGVSVDNNTLAAEPTLNHLSGGSSPTFTVAVEDSGEFPQTNVKVDVTVTAGGKEYKASRTIEKTEPGKTSDIEVPVSNIPTGVAAKVEVQVEKVPGETNVENNKASYLAIFE